MRSRVYVSVGSNINRAYHTREAACCLEDFYGDLSLSSVYESEAVGFEGDSFYNMVIAFSTQHSPAEVNDSLHQIEDKYGRLRSGPRFSSRTLDLDLLLFDDLVMDAAGLVLPREEILLNAFVLCPLAEMAPELIHPVAGRAMQALWDAFDKDKQRLKPISFDF